MADRKQRLELTWIGKEERPRLEPRILLEDQELSYQSRKSPRSGARSDHLLIQGDNLLALKALEQEYRGKIKCIYIDPPYNTGSAFFTYDDGLEHSIWLSLMQARLEILWKLLTPENGTLLISINDDECHYLKVLCDELFGRRSFVTTFVWNYEGNTDNQAKVINYHEYVLVYSKTGDIDEPQVIDPTIDTSSKLYRDEIRNTVVKNGPKNPPVAVTLPVGFPASFESGEVKRTGVQWPKYSNDLVVHNARLAQQATATSGWSSRKILEAFIDNEFEPVLDSKGQLTTFELTRTGAIEAVKKREQRKGHVLSVLRGFGTTNQMRLLLKRLGLQFSYPKPVDLVAYLIEVFTGPDDTVLDSFAGSGTTAHAVMKLNAERNSKRRCILVELDETTAREVIVPRLRAVTDGHDGAGLPGYGGGFRYLRLASSLLARDKWGNWVVSKAYHPEMLAEAMCKLEGFRYDPDPNVFWIHGNSTETDLIYVTTQNLSREQLQFISDQVGAGRTLLICCGAFRAKRDEFPNLTVKKIPQTVLTRCEWGRDDYSLNVDFLPPVQVVEELSSEPDPDGGDDGKKASNTRRRRKKASAMQELPLFAVIDDGENGK